jgi:lipopolysaccharide cholinephosphotransferase
LALQAQLQNRLDGLHSEIQHAKNELTSLRRELGDARFELRRATEDNEAFATHDDLRFWALYRQPDESLLDARRRFFSTLPPATGKLREAQLAAVRLLQGLAELCDKNGLTYWVVAGTLLGAVRSGSFVPWDDDCDVQMPRPDLEKLLALVGSDDRFEITVVYDRYVYCQQFRFKSRNRDTNAFVDIFTVDITALPDGLSPIDLYEQRRRALEVDLDHLDEDSKQAWAEHPYLDASAPEAARIAAVFRRHTNEAMAEAATRDANSNNIVLFGVDNLRPPRPAFSAYRIDQVLPTTTVELEGLKFAAPADTDALLRANFGDYWALPKDIHTHYQHIPVDGE